MTPYSPLRKKILSVLFIGLLLVPFATLAPHPHGHTVAHAQTTAVAEVGPSLIEETLTAGSSAITSAATSITAAFSSAGSFKETVLDPLAWFVAKALIKQISRSIINWINSGFEGSPAFVTDFGGFLEEAADIAIGQYIEGNELSKFLCDPFELQIRIALALRHRPIENITCRLTDVIANVQNFVSGTADSFQNGGWRGWFQLSVSESPYSQYLEAETALSIKIAGEQERRTKELDFGSGFLSWKECDAPPASDAEADFEAAQGQFGGPQGNEPRCSIVTPGSFIEDQLVDVAGSGIRQLEIADEINEIVSALVVQLVTQVFSGGGGRVQGLSRSNGSSASYLDDLVASSNIPEGVVLGTGSPGSVAGNPSQALLLEQTYRDKVNNAFQAVVASEILLAELALCNPNQANTTLNQQVLPLKETLEQELFETEQNILFLEDLNARLGASQDQETIDDILAEYNARAEEGVFHTIEEVSLVDRDVKSITDTMAEIDIQTRTRISNCPSGPGGLEQGASEPLPEGGGGDGDTG